MAGKRRFGYDWTKFKSQPVRPGEPRVVRVVKDGQEHVAAYVGNPDGATEKERNLFEYVDKDGETVRTNLSTFLHHYKCTNCSPWQSVELKVFNANGEFLWVKIGNPTLEIKIEVQLQQGTRKKKSPLPVPPLPRNVNHRPPAARSKTLSPSDEEPAAAARSKTLSPSDEKPSPPILHKPVPAAAAAAAYKPPQAAAAAAAAHKPPQAAAAAAYKPPQAAAAAAAAANRPKQIMPNNSEMIRKNEADIATLYKESTKSLRELKLSYEKYTDALIAKLSARQKLQIECEEQLKKYRERVHKLKDTEGEQKRKFEEQLKLEKEGLQKQIASLRRRNHECEDQLRNEKQRRHQDQIQTRKLRFTKDEAYKKLERNFNKTMKRHEKREQELVEQLEDCLDTKKGIWTEYTTGDGRPYYVNSLTKKTVWNLPPHARVITEEEHKERKERNGRMQEQARKPAVAAAAAAAAVAHPNAIKAAPIPPLWIPENGKDLARLSRLKKDLLHAENYVNDDKQRLAIRGETLSDEEYDLLLTDTPESVVEERKRKVLSLKQEISELETKLQASKARALQKSEQKDDDSSGDEEILEEGSAVPASLTTSQKLKELKNRLATIENHKKQHDTVKDKPPNTYLMEDEIKGLKAEIQTKEEKLREELQTRAEKQRVQNEQDAKQRQKYSELHKNAMEKGLFFDRRHK